MHYLNVPSFTIAVAVYRMAKEFRSPTVVLINRWECTIFLKCSNWLRTVLAESQPEMWQLYLTRIKSKQSYPPKTHDRSIENAEILQRILVQVLGSYCAINLMRTIALRLSHERYYSNAMSVRNRHF